MNTTIPISQKHRNLIMANISGEAAFGRHAQAPSPIWFLDPRSIVYIISMTQGKWVKGFVFRWPLLGLVGHWRDGAAWKLGILVSSLRPLCLRAGQRTRSSCVCHTFPIMTCYLRRGPWKHGAKQSRTPKLWTTVTEESCHSSRRPCAMLSL